VCVVAEITSKKVSRLWVIYMNISDCTNCFHGRIIDDDTLSFRYIFRMILESKLQGYHLIALNLNKLEVLLLLWLKVIHMHINVLLNLGNLILEAHLRIFLLAKPLHGVAITTLILVFFLVIYGDFTLQLSLPYCLTILNALAPDQPSIFDVHIGYLSS